MPDARCLRRVSPGATAARGRAFSKAVAEHEELTGPDVIVAHRLLKNAVRERLDVDGYALHTDACMRALSVEPGTLGLVEHREDYDDIGEVVCWVDDLGERWRYERERRRTFVTPADAEEVHTVDLPVSAPAAWEWLSAPEKRLLYQGVDEIDEETHGGRRGVGTTNHCVHGKQTIVVRFLDWRPYHYFTVETDVPGIGPWAQTFELEPIDADTTRVHLRPERLTGVKARLLWAMMRRKVRAEWDQEQERLRSLLEEERVPSGA